MTGPDNSISGLTPMLEVTAILPGPGPSVLRSDTDDCLIVGLTFRSPRGDYRDAKLDGRSEVPLPTSHWRRRFGAGARALFKGSHVCNAILYIYFTFIELPFLR